jgi:hypothetical protein
MPHYKRKKTKNARGGCLMCKPWKVNGAKGSDYKPNDRRTLERAGYEQKTAAD